MQRKTSLSLLLLIAAGGLCPVTGNGSAAGEGDVISGWGWVTIGRIEKSYYDKVRHSFYDLNKSYSSCVHMGLTLDKHVTEAVRLVFQAGAAMSYPEVPGNDKRVQTQMKSFKPYLMQASVSSQAWSSPQWGLDVKGGYFSVKTNPEAQNLGDYLFRSGTYFPYLVSGFEIADKIKVLGLQTTLTWQKIFSQELFLISQTEVYPLYDFSLAYIARYRPFPLIDVSAGFNIDRLVIVDKRKTIPRTDTVIFTRAFTDIPLVAYLDTLRVDTLRDPATGQVTSINAQIDTINATFAGVKAMARMAIDPKWFLPLDILGKEDLKIYTEIAVLGWKNYPTWYENRRERMPVMFGVNIPAFKLLDVVALEWEWYGSRYTNSQENIWLRRSPVPYAGAQVSFSPASDNYKNSTRDNWKWSLYFSREFGGFLRISGQFANDHKPRTQGSFEDITQTPKDWYWKLRCMFFF